MEKKERLMTARVEQTQADEFIKICKKLDTTASREIRKFIKKFIQEHKNILTNQPT